MTTELGSPVIIWKISSASCSLVGIFSMSIIGGSLVPLTLKSLIPAPELYYISFDYTTILKQCKFLNKIQA